MKTFEISLSPLYSVPANTGRNETGMAILTLFDSGELGVDITINNLSSTDVLTASHIHSGDLVSNGGVLITLVDFQNISFVNNRATGVVLLSTQQFAEIQESDLYVNVHSQEKPSGLIRGSVDKVIDFAMDVMLSPSNVLPAIVGRNETGIAYLRLTANSDLYYKLIVNDLDMTDALKSAHIHAASSGSNGGVMQALAGGPSDFDITKMVTFDTAKRATFLNDDLYINVHTTQQPGGLLRGQIR